MFYFEILQNHFAFNKTRFAICEVLSENSFPHSPYFD